MERKQSTEAKNRVIRRSVSHGGKNQDIGGGNGLVSAKSLLDEGDSKKPSHQNDDRKSDFVAKNKGKTLQNKLKRYLRSMLLLSDRFGLLPGSLSHKMFTISWPWILIFSMLVTYMCVHEILLFRIHVESPSLLSSTSGFENYRGLLNLCILLMVRYMSVHPKMFM